MSIAITSPPAKLNLFLEIPARRDDGYHEIDTVMAAIDWRDELTVEAVPQSGVQLTTHWLPSIDEVAQELGVDPEAPLLAVPTDQSNLVCRALSGFQKLFQIEGGFRVVLGKRIPAGAGMGGASSDAAHAIRCAAQLHQIAIDDPRIFELASSIGSDVPFFLPVDAWPSVQRSSGDLSRKTAGLVSSARARGRGELLEPLHECTPLHAVVVYPAVGLSTPEVYGRLKVPLTPTSANGFIESFQLGNTGDLASQMINRLSEPALEIFPELGELIESLWQSGLQPCQLTGSGSACFGVARDAVHAREVLTRLKIELQPGVLLKAVRTVSSAAPIEIRPS